MNYVINFKFKLGLLKTESTLILRHVWVQVLRPIPPSHPDVDERNKNKKLLILKFTQKRQACIEHDTKK